MAAYPPETVIAEKLEAMVALGLANSRMKDFFDLYVMSRTMAFEGMVLTKAIRATFRRRQTPIPEQPPPALSPEFASDTAKWAQWSAFVKRIDAAQRPLDFVNVVESIGIFAGPLLSAATGDMPFSIRWPPKGPWQDGPIRSTEEM